MNTETSKVTTKGQTTIPASFRKDLNILPGDTLLFIKEGDTLKMKKATPLDVEYYQSIQVGFSSEWNSPEDKEAYDDLP